MKTSLFTGSNWLRVGFLTLVLLCVGDQTLRAGEALSDSAQTQIAALMAEKEARTPAQRKMDSQLVYHVKQTANKVAVAAAPKMMVDLKADAANRVLVDIKATITDDLRKFITATGGLVVSDVPNFDAMRALVPTNAIEALAGRVDVRFVEPAALGMTNLGSKLSEAVRTHRADTALTTFGADGTGLKIGVLSDGVNSLTASKANGNLNANATVLSGQAGSGDEGTAMMELIQDMLPGAQLTFATAFNGTASFASNIQALQAAGCTVIVDDVTYFNESPFQDQVISQAVTTVSNAGVMYFSSARNSGNKDAGTAGTWEGDFLDGGVAGAPVTTAGNLHNFGATAYNTVASGGNSPRADLFWSDPLGASTNDYDLFVLNSTGASVLRSSTNIQSGTQDPYEAVSTLTSGERIVIVKKTGAAGRFLHLDTGRMVLTTSTQGNVRGHNCSGATNAFSVAATDVHNSASPNFFVGGATNPVETFSSDGPRRMFYQPNGTPFTAGNFSSTGGTVLNKPEITAADGSMTSVTGFNPFYGTSAAAPHAAAIAAMLKSYNSSLTPASIRTLMQNNALDIGAAGFDRNSGFGIVMALQSLQAAPVPNVLTISQTGLNATGPAGGPFTPLSGTYTLTNTSGSSLNWTVGSTQSWTSISPSSGTLAAGNSVVVTCAINSTNAAALAAGSYIDTVTITNVSAGFSRQFSVNLVVTAVVGGNQPVTALPTDGSTSGNARAPTTVFNYERSVYLITAAELASNGVFNGAAVSGIGWNYQAAPVTGGSAPLKIYLQNTADTTNTKSTTWTTAISGMTTAHNATTTLPATAGTFDITFSGGSAFTYTGGGLYVAFDWGQYTSTLSTTTVVYCTQQLASGLLGAQSTVSAPTTIAASNFRPETRLTIPYLNAPSVVSPTTANITAVSATLGGNVTLNWNSSLTARGIVYSKTSLNSSPQIGGSNVTVVNDASITTGTFTENISGLTPGTAYSFVAFATNSVGTTYTSPVSTFNTPSNNANLANLVVTTATLSPPFVSGTNGYTASVSNATTSVTVTPTVSQANATVTVNASAVTSGSASSPIALNVGANTITVVVTAQDLTTTNTYTITLTRTPATYIWSGGSGSGGNGTWAVGTTGWDLGNWIDGNFATIGKGTDTAGTITVSTTVKPGSLTFVAPSNSGVYILNGGTIDLSGGAATFTTAATINSILANGSVVVSSGKVTLAGVNTYSGTTAVNGGTLVVNNKIVSATTVNSGATLRGSGNGSTTGLVAAAVTVNANGVIWPGSALSGSNVTSGEVLTVNSLSMTATTSKMKIAFNGSNIQQVKVNGTVALNGILSLGIPTGLGGGPYTILTSTGAISGNFTSVLLNGVANGSGGNGTVTVNVGLNTITISGLTAVTPVKIADLSAKAEGSGVNISWTAVSEYQNAGYNIYRRTAGGADWVLVNPALIAGRVTCADERKYTYFDWAMAGMYEYKLESVDLAGETEAFYPSAAVVAMDWNNEFQADRDVPAESIIAASNSFSLNASVANAVAASHVYKTQDRNEMTPAVVSDAVMPRSVVQSRSVSSAVLAPTNAGVRWFSAGNPATVSSYICAKVLYTKPGLMLIPRSAIPAGFDLNHVTLQREGRNLNILSATDLGLLVHAPGYVDNYTNKDAIFVRTTNANTVAGQPASASGLFTSPMPVNVLSAASVATTYHDVYFDYNTNLRPYTFEPWFSNKYLTQGTGQDFTINLQKGSGGPAKLTVNLWSLTTSEAVNPDHLLQVMVNGQPVGDASWSGGGRMMRILFDVNSGVLKAGDNTIRLVTPTIAELDTQIAFLHSISADYTRVLEGSTPFEVVNDGSSARMYELYNVPASGVWVVDARFNDRAALVATESKLQADGTLKVRFVAAGGGSGKYTITPVGQENSPLNVSVRQVRALRLNGTYLATGPAQFSAGTQPLMMKRSKEGIRGTYIDQEQLFDYYNYGRYGPDGIRNAVRSVKPTYLLLVGRTTYDYLNYEGMNIDPLCPAYLVGTSFWAQTTSDSAFGDLGRGYPEVAVGRLPVNNTTELSGAINHIVNYKGIPASGIKLHAVADKTDANVANFGNQLDTLVKANFPDVSWQANYLEKTYQTPQEVTAAMTAAANGGADLVLYAGHGNAARIGTSDPNILNQTSVQQWTGNTVFLQATCTANWMAKNVDDYKSIAIQALTQPQGGISASIGTSTYMTPDVAMAFINQVLKSTAGNNARWGSVLLKTQQWAGSQGNNPFYSDLMKTEQLFGDPAMPIRAPSSSTGAGTPTGTF